MTHIHRWKCEAPTNIGVPASCECGAVREFHPTIPNDFKYGTAAEAARYKLERQRQYGVSREILHAERGLEIRGY